MSIEIERKFLVKDNSFALKATYCYGISQFYIDDKTRIRFENHSDGVEKAYMTIKTNDNLLVRDEWNFKIPFDHAISCVDELKSRKYSDNKIIIKTRYVIFSGTNQDKWEVDIFRGNNNGLILAEIELYSEYQDIELPDWVGKEVTKDERYYNSYLAKYPYKDWKNNE